MMLLRPMDKLILILHQPLQYRSPDIQYSRCKRCNSSDKTVSIVGAGSTTVTLNQAADSNYNAATATMTLTGK